MSSESLRFGVFSEKSIAFLWALPFFFGSLLVFPYCLVGDQESYRRFYDGVAGLPIVEAFEFYRDSLGTGEPGYFIFVYVFAPLLPKELLFSIINLLFFYNIFLWVVRKGVSLIIFPLFYLNFYLLVLAFSAERLKLSLFIFLIGFGVPGLFRYLFYTASILTHVQTLMLLVSTQFRNILFVFQRITFGKIGIGFLYLLFLILAMALVLIVLREHIASKITYYFEAWGGIESVLKPAIFCVLAIYYARDRRIEALLASLPMMMAAYFIGAERVVIFSYFIFMFYGLQSKRGLNIGVVLTSLYFGYKGIDFMFRLVLLGDGFAGTY
ncbi:hypothetical protein J2X84_000767 [Pseudomonas corrugata]|uniref:hypothetical protein n=1 Tax=Pseudomonas corrugata TaxID=47879 RepID=UPI00285B72FB|nr:hypothetical protein [Pseudomonas corrugata]MDR7281952.1 hypothetical protein [Pseudomonas corrugata]